MERIAKMMKKSSLGRIPNKEEYLKLFMGSPHLGVSQNSGEDDFSSNAKEDLSRIKAAYEQATKTREFEIKLYWERAKYFWAFIISIYVAYYNVLVSIHGGHHGTYSLLGLSGLGFFFSVAWVLVSKGSKQWLENWEHHIYLLEDYVTGPLFKTHKIDTCSVSKVNLYAGYLVEFCAALLFYYESTIFFYDWLGELPSAFGFEVNVGILFALCFGGLVLFIIFWFEEKVKGNAYFKHENIELTRFYIQEYGEDD